MSDSNAGGESRDGHGETHASTAQPHAEEGNSILRFEPNVAFWTFVTFILLFVVLRKLAWGPMLENLDRREKAIRDSLDEAERARAEASSSLEEQRELLAKARAEAQELLAESRADAQRARQETIVKARTEAEKIVVAGRQTIEQDKRAAIVEIREVAVDLALSASSKLLRAEVDEARNRELVSGYVQELEERGEQSG